jgi:hypothetical protein
VLRRRRAWFEAQPGLEPERLVFIDETGASTNMARRYGRARRGERCRASVSHGHWKTTTFVGALRLEGMTAPMVLDGAMRRDLPRLCGAGAGANAGARRHRRHGQSVSAQDDAGAPRHRGHRGRAALPAALRPDFDPSRWPSRSSRPSSRRPQPAPRMTSGTQSHTASTHSPRPNAKTTSPPQVMTDNDRKTL